MTDYPVPTLKENIENIEKAYDAELTLEECPVDERKAESRVLGYTSNSLYGFIKYQGKQIFPESANHENLLKHCRQYGLYPKTKSAAYGSAYVSGSIGSSLAAGTVLARKRDNKEYTLDNDIVLSANPQEINLTCKTPGVAGNCAEGEILTFAKSYAGIDNQVTVKLIGGGADDEEDKDLAARLHQLIQSIYHGGNDNDYVKWALQVEGVNEAWAYPCEQGVGTMTVRIMTPDGFPDAILCQKTAEHIDRLRPPTYNEFFVVSPMGEPINLVISNLDPATDEMKAAISASLRASFAANRKPGGLVTTKQLNSAILATVGLNNYHLDSPAADIQLGIGKSPVLGVIQWI